MNKTIYLAQPNEQMIQSIIEHAIQAPSIDNTQPWKFIWSEGRLLILHSERLAQNSLNRQNHASMIALGAVIESIRLAATQYGFKVISRNLFQSHDSLSPWAEVTFSQQKLAPDLLFKMIFLRSTDRRNYNGGRIDEKIQQQINVLQSECKHCKIHIQTKPNSKFTKYYLKCEEMLWKKNQISKILWRLGWGFRIRAQAKKSLESSAALFCFSLKSVTPESLSELGQVAYKTWLILNLNKFGVQPLTFSSITIADIISGAFSTTEKETNFFENGNAVLKETFSLSENEIPVWSFRTGLSSAMPSELRTKRHHISTLMLSPSYLNHNQIRPRENRFPSNLKSIALPIEVIGKKSENFQIINISRSGIGALGALQSFENKEPFRIVVKLDAETKANLKVRMVWSKMTNEGRQLAGLEVIESPKEWVELIEQLEKGHRESTL